MSNKNSYSQILKSSSIMGGAAGFNMLLGMIRVKFAAVLIGSVGVGLVASFTSIQGLVGTIFGLGIQSSAVREISLRNGRKDSQSVGKIVVSLRRISWLTGLSGMLAMFALSPFLSQLTFGSDEYTPDIAGLGVVILLGNLYGGQMALIQGMRRIGDMARSNAIGAAFATISAIVFYVSLGLRGIVPSLVSIVSMQLLLSWFYSRQIPLNCVSLTWKESLQEGRTMVRLGLVFMVNGLLGSGFSYATVTLISKLIDVQSVGVYSASYTLSGLFVGFVLGAMGADYYPRLTSLANDKEMMSRMVNEQTEIGLLLAGPGLIGTMVFSSWIIQIFYSSEFLPAVELMQWFILGCLGRVITWPLGYIMLALGKGRWFLFVETACTLVHLLFIFIGIHYFGIVGVAIAFALLYVGYTIAVYNVASRLINFKWSFKCKKIIAIMLSLIGTVFLFSKTLSDWYFFNIGLAVTLLVGLYSLSNLIALIGTNHYMFRKIFNIPGLKYCVDIINKVEK